MHIDEMIATVVCLCTCVRAYVHMCKVAKCGYIRVHSSYMTLIGVHEMHDRVHPN